MSRTLFDLLGDRLLRDYAGHTIYQRGAAYYRGDRVDIISINDQNATCRVQGTHSYYVTISNRDGELAVSCTCPYAASGWFCKHMVAASLAVRGYLRQYGQLSWRNVLSNTLKEQKASLRRKGSKPYWFFISLQQMYEGWILYPYRLWFERVPQGILPPHPAEIGEILPELVEHNFWLLDYIKALRYDVDPVGCVNTGSEAIAFAKILISQEKARQTSYGYMRQAFPMGEFLSLMSQVEIPLFLGDAGNPVRRRLHIQPNPGELLLKVERVAPGIELSMELISNGRAFNLAETQAQPLTQTEPYWIMVADQVLVVPHAFSYDRLAAWLRMSQIVIPRENEDEFLENYFPELIKQFPISGEHIQWEEIDLTPTPRLYLADEGGELQAHLRFGYGDEELTFDSQYPNLSIRRRGDSWTLARISRQSDLEAQAFEAVVSPRYGLKRSPSNYPAYIFSLRARVDPIDFLMRYIPRLVEAGFEVYGEDKLKTVRVNRSTPTLSLNVSSGIDWFDIQAVIQFGDVAASLQDVRAALRRKEQYIKLADGTIGEIPPEWIERYKHLFGLGEQVEDQIRLSNHHITLIDQLLGESDRHQADEEFRRRRQRLMNFNGIQSQDLPAGFVGSLRPYQKAGFDWLHFLHDYEFGGCLADDMGLGKTIETLVFFQSLKEKGLGEAASLLVLPRSLLVNWQREAAHFTPDLRVQPYFGKERTDIGLDFDQYDLVLTTYGTMLRDIKKLRNYRFHYVVLDESQAIKNPLAKTSKAARLLNSDHRLVLTGTPVENSTFELWSQFAFLNPGLLGSLEYFKQEFGNPIERKGEEQPAQFLRKLVYPFILRRTKQQVAPELPSRTERVVYSDMQPAQQKFYNKTRDYYRAMLMGLIEEQGINNARMKVLEGLLRLRQISNHPRLVQEDFRGESSKFEMLLETLETLQAEGHKALVFSQFVKMLKLVRSEMDARKIPYVYLDGRTQDRQARVDTFQNDPAIPFFLISLKAGGVGLNLTAADYVIHIDPWWNPAVEIQATDRTHRIGQDKPVFVYKLITRDSVEEKILLLQERKKALVEQLITTESSFFKSLTSQDVEVLFS